MGFREYRSFWCIFFSVSYCAVGGSDTRFPEDGVRFPGGGVSGGDTQIGVPMKSTRPITLHFDRAQNEGSLRKGLDIERFTTAINLSGEELATETERPNITDKDNVEMIDNGAKGSDGATQILRGRIVNKNEMQRKQDGPLEMTGSRQNFGLNPVRILEHATVQLNPQSTLVAPPGQVVSLFFDVTNNLNVPVFFTFRAEDQHNLIRNVFPPRRWIESQRKEVVTVVLETRMQQQADANMVIFIAQLGSGAEVAVRKSLFRIGHPVSDTTGPDIDYSYNGDCRDALTPQTCTTAAWGADITVVDYESGLLSVTSFPLGLQYRGEFVAGTTDKVYLHYSASCCDTKVDVVATDLKGNTYKRTINVERQWWTAAEISAIVLGVLLLLILIGVIIAGIVTCCRNRGSRDFTR